MLQKDINTRTGHVANYIVANNLTHNFINGSIIITYGLYKDVQAYLDGSDPVRQDVISLTGIPPETLFGLTYAQFVTQVRNRIKAAYPALADAIDADPTSRAKWLQDNPPVEE